MRSYYHEDNVFFLEGCVSLETGDRWVSPWRIPFRRRDFFPFLKDQRVHDSPGVRLCFSTDSVDIRIKFLDKESFAEPVKFDVFVNNKFSEGIDLYPGKMRMDLIGGGGMADYMIYLPPDRAVWLEGISIDDDADIVTTRRPSHARWLHYGSSISQSACARPSRIWTVQVARRLGLNLRNFGFGGNCQCEPMVGRLMRDLPADYITLKLGINSYGGALSERTFGPNVIGLIQIIRDKHTRIPIGVISPIYSPEREDVKGGSGMSLKDMRETLKGIVEICAGYGDQNIHYISGLELLGEADAGLLSDKLHPNAESGQDLIAENFVKRVLSRLNPTLAVHGSMRP
ncbi:MAG: hypothetical protein JW808_09730 [Victivallales bacterium]|nr:hypothetical protein [Victivallales bacterium]